MDHHLLDLGFAFKKSQLWKKVYEEELFAIHLPERLRPEDGSEYAYCAVMGRNGVHRALGVYLGNRGFASLRTMNQGMDYDEKEDVDILFCQDCVQCSIEAADQFMPEDLEFIKEEARKRKTRAPYPRFSRYRPYSIPWRPDPKDQEILTLALEVTLALADYLQDHEKWELPLNNVIISSMREQPGDRFYMRPQYAEMEEFEKKQRIPVLSVKEGKLTVDEMIPLPEPMEAEYPKPTVIDELRLTALKKIRKAGALECEVFRIPEPTKEESEDSAPYLPAVLLSVDENGMVRFPIMMRYAVYDPNEAVNELLRRMTEEKFRPKEIRVRTKETFSLLELFCEKAGIRLEREEDLDLLDEAKDDLLERFADDMEDDEEGDFEPFDIIGMMEELPDSELRTMPGFLLEKMVELAEEGLLSATLAARIRKIAKERGR